MNPKRGNRWLGLAVLGLGLAMVVADLSIVNVAIPSIIEQLDIDFTTAEWINTIYSLVFAALLVTLGRLGDLVGRRLVFVAGVATFAGGSLLAGLAPTGATLLAARLVQGIGGAAIAPATLSIISAEFRGRQRDIAFGIWGSIIGGMAAVGPLLGGWLTTNASWRWAFLINIPIAVVVLVGSALYLGRSRDEDAEPRFDLPGAVLSAIGLGGLVFGLIEGYKYGWWGQSRPFSLLGLAWPSDWPISVIPVVFAASALALAAFTVREVLREHRGDHGGVFAFRLFRFAGYRYGNLTAVVLSLGEFGLIFVIPLFLQGMLGLSAWETGLVLLPLAVGAFVAGPSAGMLASRIGPKWVVTCGMFLEAIAIAWIGLLFSVDLQAWALLPPLAVYGIGVGLGTAQLTNVALAEVPSHESGVASGGISTLRQVGSALGIAILGTVLAIGLSTGTRSRLTDSFAQLPPAALESLHVPADQAVDLIAAPIETTFGQALPEVLASPMIPEAARPHLVPVIRDAVESSFVDGARTSAFIATAFVVLGMLFSLLIPNNRSTDSARAAAVMAGEPVR